LSALCLADAVSLRAVDLAEIFQKIAAGITLLERRASGQAPMTETIVLAAA
jgi:hypothetical protein